MHAVLTLTLMHDRYLSTPLDTRRSNPETFHWYRGIALFNSKLSGSIQPSDRDALWATTILFGTIAFFHIEAKTPEEAWPLKPPSPLDLNWLRMSDGKKEIWKLTQPWRVDSVFRPLVLEHMNYVPPPSSVIGLEALPSEFLKFYSLDTMSTTANNPYHAAVSALAQTLHSNCKYSILMSFLSFISHMHSDYKRLLELKDPGALLLLAYWYAKVCQCQYWALWRRAELECQAICI